VQGAEHIPGPLGVDCDLRRWGLKLAERFLACQTEEPMAESWFLAVSRTTFLPSIAS
jgi:hypothetical protein